MINYSDNPLDTKWWKQEDFTELLLYSKISLFQFHRKDILKYKIHTILLCIASNNASIHLGNKVDI